MKVSYVAPDKWHTRAFGCLLPTGNANDFPVMEAELRRRKVDYAVICLDGGARYFLFPETELRKLPTWQGKRYIPVGKGQPGHSVYHITVFQIAGQIRWHYARRWADVGFRVEF